MLPNILDIAQQYELDFDPKNYAKKETLTKCPFCKADHSKEKTYYLSLNTKDQVYKCWYCGESGGVIKFEAKVSGENFTSVREKYFGKKKNLHPAFKLNPNQLEEIGWLSIKQRDFKGFQKNPEKILSGWKDYVYHEHSKFFALFMCMAQLENKKQKQKESLKWFMGKCNEKPIPNLYNCICKEYNKSVNKRQRWANRGITIARIAWKTSIKTLDINLDDLYVNVLFIDYFVKSAEESKKGQKKHNQKRLCKVL